MNYRGHLIGGLIVSGIAVACNNYISIPGVILGSFLPDLDCRSGSTIRKIIPIAGKIYNLLPECKLFGYKGSKHRSLLLHSIWTDVFLLFLAWYFDSSILLGLFFGVLNHHILDEIKL